MELFKICCVLLSLIVMVKTEDLNEDEEVIDLLKKILREKERHNNKRAFDSTTSKEEFKKLIRRAQKEANETVLEYVSLKDIDSQSSTGLTHQNELKNLHRAKEYSFYFEITGLYREEISYEIEKEVNGETARSSPDYVTIADLSEFTNFKEAYPEAVPRSLCSSKQPDCKNNAKYRTADGTCNNLNNRLWGSTYTAQERNLSPVYEDGIRAPRSVSVLDGSSLPSPRDISNEFFHSNVSDPQTSEHSVMAMAWGQYIDHDITLTPTSKDESDMDCCTADRVECQPISLPIGDPRFRRQGCMTFTRSSPGPLLQNGCAPEPRQQINQITAFIDASNVYGSSVEESDDLRNNTGETLLALLNVSNHDLPPPDVDSVCRITDPQYHCLRAGDVRVNAIPNLQFLHTLFVREHNRIVTELTALKPNWGERKLFDETRKIVGAINQHITYSEYLPKILGPDRMNTTGLVSSADDPYDVTMNPSIRNEFAAAAYRFGHSQIKDHQSYFRPDYTRSRNSRLRAVFNDPEMLEQNDGERVSHLARWIVSDKGMEVDRFVEEEPRDWLFTIFDLASLNIQRGRDHGLPSYTEWYEHCNSGEITDWDDMQQHTPEVVDILKEIYKTPKDIDLYVGGVSEIHDPGAAVGPTFGCIIAEQFKALKTGDRFFYERTNVMDANVGLTSDQIAAIKKVTLSSVICNNVPDIGSMQPDAFRPPDELNDNIDTNERSNALKSCLDYPEDHDLDLTKW